MLPRELRFMGEDDVDFHVVCRDLARHVSEALNTQEPLSILDLGCGYGRLAYGLVELGFKGSYLGIDVLENQVRWLQENFAPETGGMYRFERFDLRNERYNSGGGALAGFDFGLENNSLDAIAAISLFTHMHEQDVVEYLTTFSEFLKPGGLWITTFFQLPPDFSLASQNEKCRYPLRKQVSAAAFVHNEADPLHVIAYREEFLRSTFDMLGLEVVDDRPGYWYSGTGVGDFQDWFVLRKKDATRSPARRISLKRSPDHEDGIKKVHIGCGPHQIWPEWWNVDIRPFPNIDEQKDVTKPWTWRQLKRIYAEHFIQELFIDDALAFLQYAGNALEKGGVMRLSTPNLRWVLQTHLDPAEADPKRCISGTLAVNRAFHGWGHQFLYTDEFLSLILVNMGFSNVQFFDYGQSDVPDMQGLEAHGGFFRAAGLPSVVIVQCTREDREIRVPSELRDMIEDEFGRYVKYGH